MAGTSVERFLHGPAVDQVLADETDGSAVRWSLSDSLGTVRDLVNNAGTVINHLVYDAYGKVTSETDSNVDFLYGFTGRERDEQTGLNYHRARWYDPAVGRWISEDPIGFEGGDGNLSRFSANGLPNATDPSGHATEWWKNFGQFIWQWHHLLPQELFTNEFLKRHGLNGQIDINCPEFGWWLQARDHVGTGGIHPAEWNAAWETWISQHDKGKGTITKEMILTALEEFKSDPDFKPILSRGIHVASHPSQSWRLTYKQANDHYMSIVRSAAKDAGMSIDDFLARELRASILDEVKRLGPSQVRKLGGLKVLAKAAIRKLPAGVGLVLTALTAKEALADFDRRGAAFVLCDQVIPIELIESVATRYVGDPWDEWFAEYTNQERVVKARIKKGNPQLSDDEVEKLAWDIWLQHMPPPEQ